MSKVLQRKLSKRNTTRKPGQRITGGKTDWDRLRSMSDEDIARGVAQDPDAWIPPDSWWDKAKLVLPETKEVVTMRIDRDILDWFRKSGRGYQTRINSVLRAFVEAQERHPR